MRFRSALSRIRHAYEADIAVTASSRMPPALNIIALATFSAALSARALDPVLPHVDRAFSALITDLEQRGLLASTLVVLMGEMGRTPRIRARPIAAPRKKSAPWDCPSEHAYPL